jgi:hypothetical protein
VQAYKIDPFGDIGLTKMQEKLLKPLPGREMKGWMYLGRDFHEPEVV